MDQFTPQTIGCLLLIGAAIFIAVKGFFSWCKREDAKWAERNPAPDSEGRQQEIAAEHVAKREPAYAKTIKGNLNLAKAFTESTARYATAAESEGGTND